MNEITIKPAGNGFTVRVRDPEIEKKNRGDGPWNDPCVEYVFTDKKKAATFLEKAMDTLSSGSEYETAFFKALMEENTDG